MNPRLAAVAAFGPTALFVLLWSSGALFSKLGLAHAAAVPFLGLRFGLALAVLSVIVFARGRWLPRPGSVRQVATTGVVLVGGYSLTYLYALDFGMTPGLLATLLGLQPLVTLLVTERPLRRSRIAGLLLALAGLVLVVLDSLLRAQVAMSGFLCAFGALVCITVGTLMQRRLQQSPVEVLPLQYAVALAMCIALLPVADARVAWTGGLALAVGWLGLVISVAATLLLYRLIQVGNLVNVTSLFYLVPAGTAALDWIVLGNAMGAVQLVGTGAILAGIVVVYVRSPALRRSG
ncbi:MAG TPA: DMT family transporter [Ramlibacter sp.]|jgi:drug/metabolite transporter (DMT)-like permease|nr:DMT family transporter [Ramlibacter sp.]